MMKLVKVAVAVVALSSLTGCQLCLLPCYICAAFSGGGNTAAAGENKEIPAAEIGPTFASQGGLLADRGATTH